MPEINKYYVGAEHIGNAIARGDNAPVCRATLDMAIEDARKKLRDSTHVEAVVIVEIIRVVRRREPPIVVEEV